MRPLCSETSAHAAELIQRHPFAAILCDDVLLDGVFRAVSRQPAVPVIVVSRQDDWGCYLRAMKAGAFDYVLFPFSTSEVERILQSALLSSKADCHPRDNSSVAGACFAESHFKSGDVEGALSRQTATELLLDAPEKTRRDALLEWLLCLASALQTPPKRFNRSRKRRGRPTPHALGGTMMIDVPDGSIEVDNPAEILRSEDGIFEVISPYGHVFQVTCRRGRKMEVHDLSEAPQAGIAEGMLWRIRRLARRAVT